MYIFDFHTCFSICLAVHFHHPINNCVISPLHLHINSIVFSQTTGCNANGYLHDGLLMFNHLSKLEFNVYPHISNQLHSMFVSLLTLRNTEM